MMRPPSENSPQLSNNPLDRTQVHKLCRILVGLYVLMQYPLIVQSPTIWIGDCTIREFNVHNGNVTVIF